jgi:nicotinamidase-related amidase
MKALIVVDMLVDFVEGALANPDAQRIVEPIRKLLAHAREHGWVVVYSNDGHRAGDPELRVWGEHAMEGTPGAQVIDALAPQLGDIISTKRVYGAFDFTRLDEALKSRDVDEVVVTGQHTHICVRHTSYGALIRGYAIVVPRDAVCAFPGVDEEAALAYLAETYGARITSVTELIAAAPGDVGVA